LFFSKFKPFSGIPAGMLLLTSGVTFFFATSVAWPFKLPDAAGVRGSLNGCAADVDVAAGGVCDDVESPCRGAVCVATFGEIGVALLRRDEVVRNRCGCGIDDEDIRTFEAARRQLRQIILGVVDGQFALLYFMRSIKTLACDEMQAELFLRWPTGANEIASGVREWSSTSGGHAPEMDAETCTA
jgi:hypothetical protein